MSLSPEYKECLKQHCQDELVALFEATSTSFPISATVAEVARWMTRVEDASFRVKAKASSILDVDGRGPK